jgi:hypothetical protein
MFHNTYICFKDQSFNITQTTSQNTDTRPALLMAVHSKLTHLSLVSDYEYVFPSKIEQLEDVSTNTDCLSIIDNDSIVSMLQGNQEMNPRNNNVIQNNVSNKTIIHFLLYSILLFPLMLML